MTFNRDSQAPNPNSARNWAEPLAAVADRHEDVQTPATRFVGIDRTETAAWIDGNENDFSFDEIRSAAEEIGYPVFVRTDITSAKHQGLKGMKAGDEEELRTTVRWATEAAIMMMGAPDPESVMLREWLDLQAPFTKPATITDSEVPIAREFRAFASPDKLHCIHFYWPKDAITNPGVEDFPDAHPDDKPKTKYPSWERIAWAIERNDFWMKRLGFSQTKGGKEKLETLRGQYGNSLIDPEQTDDKHLGEWAEQAQEDADA